MASAPHVITRQRLTLRLGAAADGPALHRRAELALLGPSLLAALDAALTQALAGAGLAPDAWLTLDRLALDLGPLRSDALEAQLLERLPGLLRHHLAEALAAAALRHPAQPVGPQLVGSGSELPLPAAPAAGAEWAPRPGIAPSLPAVPAVHQALAPVAAGAAWLFFLQFGSLPAHWPPPATPADWEASLRPLLAAPAPALLAGLRAALARPAGRLRLLRQFSPALAAAVVVALAPSAAPHQKRLAQVLAALLRPPAGSGAAGPPGVAAGSFPAIASEAFCLAVLTRAAGSGPPPDWATVLAALPGGGRRGAAPLPAAALWQAAEALAPGLVALPSAAVLDIAGAPAASPEVPVPPKTPLGPPASGGEQGPIFLSGPVGAGATPAPVGPAGAALRGAGSAASGVAGSAAKDAAGSPEALPADQAEYVTNAGVVLLHPFLPMCFEACGWLDADHQFLSPEAQAQAVLLVHFLATGRGQAPEYELRLPRLLCGVPPTAPAAPRRLVLGRAARAEGRALLRAALEHWAALRNTTPTGLRTAFLQREGKLEAGLPGGPLLTVAQQAQDVLLGRLPYGWGVGVVQLPWLPQRLSVSWA